MTDDVDVQDDGENGPVDVTPVDDAGSWLSGESEIRIRGRRDALLAVVAALNMGTISLNQAPEPTTDFMAIAVDSVLDDLRDEGLTERAMADALGGRDVQFFTHRDQIPGLLDVDLLDADLPAVDDPDHS